MVRLGSQATGNVCGNKLNTMGIGTETQNGVRIADSLLNRATAQCSDLVRTAVRDGLLPLVDQAVVSGARFFVTVMVGRICGPEELGVYSLGFTVWMLIACAQESLISLPYTIYGNRLKGRQRTECAGSALAHCGMLTAVAVIGLALAGILMTMGFGLPRLAPVIWILAGIVPFMLLLEFARRFAFAHLRLTAALVLDLAVATILIAGLSLLALTGALSAVTAYAVMGLGCAVGGIAWLGFTRKRFAVKRQPVLRDLSRNWSFGRWAFAGRMVLVTHGQVIPWLLAAMLGTAATGIYFACETVVMLSNPLLLGVGNVLTPRIARAFAQGGRRQVRWVVGKATLMLAIVMAPVCVLFVILGDRILLILYGSEFAGRQYTIAALAIAVLAHALGMAAASGLWVLERPRVTFAANLLGLTITLVMASLLVKPFGILGAACAVPVGRTVASAVQYIAICRLTGGATTEGGDS